MTRVLVTGADGFVGRALCRDLAGAGFGVVAATRDLVAVGPDTEWREVLEGIDAIAHLAAPAHASARDADERVFRRINVDGTRRLAEAAVDAGIGRFLFMSTAKVMGESSGDGCFRGDDAPAPADAYARSKRDAELALAEVARGTPLETVVLRPPLVYGPGVRANFLALMRLAASGVPLPLGSVRNRRSLVYLDNLTAAAVACLGHPAAAGRTYFVRDGADVSTPGLVRALAAALGRRARLWPAPPGALRLLGRLTGRAGTVARLLDSLAVDDSTIRGELRWRPRFDLTQGLAETASWFHGRHRQHGGRH